MGNHTTKFKNGLNTRVVRCTHCFKSVSVPSRMAIYNHLNKTEGKEATVGEIVNHVGLTQPTISYHLQEMKNTGLLKSKKVGKEVFYSVNKVCPHFGQECVLYSLKFPEIAHVGN